MPDYDHSQQHHTTHAKTLHDCTLLPCRGGATAHEAAAGIIEFGAVGDRHPIPKQVRALLIWKPSYVPMHADHLKRCHVGSDVHNGLSNHLRP